MLLGVLLCFDTSSYDRLTGEETSCVIVYVRVIWTSGTIILVYNTATVFVKYRLLYESLDTLFQSQVESV